MKWECHDMETMRQFGSQFVCCTRGAGGVGEECVQVQVLVTIGIFY